MCLYPKLIKNRKYMPNKKNGGIVPPIVDNRVLVVPIGCQNCIECRRKKAREWQVRLMEDIRHNKNGIFVTLTFSNESIKQIIEGKDTDGKQIADPITLKGYELDNEIGRIAVRRFLERWRRQHGKSVRHWLVTELGHKGTENIHLHGIIWTDKPREQINKIWKYGYTWIQDEKKKMNESIVNYIVKYINKPDKDHAYYKSIVLCSKGIGNGYTNRHDSKLNKFKGKETKENYTTRQGYKINLPVYWRNKIYTEQERENLWLHKLDEQIRYVDKQKIDVSKGYENYYLALKDAREKNKRLKYGNDEINWDRKKYELERRQLNYKIRLKRDNDIEDNNNNNNTNQIHEIKNMRYEEIKYLDIW